MRNRRLLAVLTACVVVLTPVLGSHISGVHASLAPPHILAAQTPDAVIQGSATLIGHHDPNATLTLNIGLGVHDSAKLDAIIGAASNPSSPYYGHYLTNAQYMAEFAPTDAEAQAVRDWASGAGLMLVATSPDNLLVTVRGTTTQVEHALGVTINDYRLPDRAFYSNDRDATVPGNLDIRAISGLNSFRIFHTYLTRTQFRSGGYFPNDFRTAYNATAVGDGSGQTIGFTLWGTSVPQSDLNAFASHTGTTAIVGGQSGANGIDWVPVNGGSSDTNELVETAMDVEYAHGMAPNSHLRYWLSDCSAVSGGCNPSDTGLELAISDAANDSSVHVVSNSWGGGEAPSLSDPFTSNTNASFQHADSVGTTFYFSSGDQGSNSGGSGLPSFPADSPYVVSVGGTTLNTNSSFGYSSESGWSGSGGGCSSVFARPSWQTGVGGSPHTSCSGRAEPDVAADADPNTGAWVYVQGVGQQVGGTSLAAPLWSGMAADINNNLGSHGQALMGFSAPRIYQLANNATTYARDFHDVTSGSNGAFSAVAGYDQVTGWGSPNGGNLVADWSGGGGNPTPTNTPSGGNPTPTNTPSTGGGNCTSDGVCITSFTASASSVPVGTNVTLTANTNTDVGPTVYYILIVNESGTILTSCSTGTTCTVTVSSSVAASHQYTAYLSTSSTSNTANAHSNTVGVTWTGGGNPTPTNTPVPPTPTNTPSTGGGNCTSDGYCLTSFTASASSVPVGTNVTLTANTNSDVGPSPYYILIVNESGTILTSCSSGTTCTVTVSSSVAATHHYTAYLSTSSTSNTANAHSNTVGVSWTSGGNPTPTPTPSGGFTNPVVNGGFETGTLSGWTSGGVSGAGVAVVSTLSPHSGSYDGRVGERLTSQGAEPVGDNCLYQNENFSGSHTLTLWYSPYDMYGDTITYDWQEAYWRPYGTIGCSETGTRLFRIESNSQTWTQVNVAVSGPGQIYFNVHEDGGGDPTALYFDDISIH